MAPLLAEGAHDLGDLFTGEPRRIGANQMKRALLQQLIRGQRKRHFPPWSLSV